MAGSTGPNIVEDGLVLALDAANTKSYPGSGTNVIDLSRNNSTSTLTNGPTFDSTYGSAFDFDGVDDKITTPVTATNWADVEFSIQIWTSDCTLNDSVFAMGHDGGASNFGLVGFYWSTSNRIRNYWRSGDGTLSRGFFMEVPHDRTAPNNLCMTYTGIGGTNSLTIANNCNLYFNGIQQTRSIGGSAPVPSNSILELSGGNYPLNGKIHNTLYYNRVLSADEVLQNYNATKTRFI